MQPESQHLQTARTAFELWKRSQATTAGDLPLERSSTNARDYADEQMQHDWTVWLGGYTARQMHPPTQQHAANARARPDLLVPPSDHDDLETNLQEHVREAFERRRESPPLTGVDIFIAVDYYQWAWEDCIAKYGRHGG